MIRAVIILARSAGNDAASATTMFSRRLHRVLVVVTARALRQRMFVIAEHHPIAIIGKRPSALDRTQGLPRLERQIGGRDFPPLFGAIPLTRITGNRLTCLKQT